MARQWDTTPNDYIDLTHNDAIDFSGPTSIAFWFKGTDDDFRIAFSLSLGSASSDFFYVGIGKLGPSNELLTVVRKAAGTTDFLLSYQTTSRSELLDGNWHHVALTTDGFEWKVYIDAQQKTLSTTLGANSGLFGNASHDTATLGAYKVSDAYSLFLDGDTLAEFAIWSTVLWANSLRQLKKNRLPPEVQPNHLKTHYRLNGRQDPERSNVSTPGVATNNGTTGVVHDIPSPRRSINARMMLLFPIIIPPATYIHTTPIGPKMGLRME